MATDLEFIRRFFEGSDIKHVYAWRDELLEKLALADQYLAERELKHVPPTGRCERCGAALFDSECHICFHDNGKAE